MSSYRSFAVAGAGRIGVPIVSALLAKGIFVVVLARAPKDVPAGATLVVVDYNDVSALTVTLKAHNVDVVVSTLGARAISAQTPLADAAKAAGVHLFVPSEFGGPTEGATVPEFAERDKQAKHLAAIGLPYARIHTGWFMSAIPWALGITDTGSVHVVGTGDVPLSLTAEEDVAGFVAYITTTLPPAELANRAFRVQGDRATLRQIAALFDKPVIAHDGPPKELSPIHGFLLSLVEMGTASTGYDWVTKKDVGTAGSANALWPKHHWKSIREVHGL